MSWLFSRALVAEYCLAKSSVTESFAPLKTTPTARGFCSHGKMTGLSRLSRYGMTFAPLTDALGVGLLIWYREGFPARTSAQQEPEPELTASDPASGGKWHELSVKFDRATSSWKTHRCLWEEDLPECLVTLPRMGLILNGLVYQPRSVGRRTSATESGFWPTPTVSGNNNRKGISPKASDGLATAVLKAEKFPTPTATSAKGWSEGHNRANTNDRLDYLIEREAYQSGETGRLNPTWVEWLMGWPPGWTEFAPLATDKYRAWQQQHSPC